MWLPHSSLRTSYAAGTLLATLHHEQFVKVTNKMFSPSQTQSPYQVMTVNQTTQDQLCMKKFY